MLALILGYVGASISERGPTEKHTFRYRRAEIITSVINASTLFVIGIYIIFEAFKRFQNLSQVDPFWMVIVAGIVLSGNIGSIFLLRREEKVL
ncbi:hypothetical protein AKJ56_00295 [candidate division MSBL1 archaeon SCGC-AAA382N08]|uniref:Cation efflux protein transmembrane domain-containing protein n=1 Tax=candidate division MSBL1 archaeon SCGC-AAA382N08 TaxID=1698285 RepID=A0A133VQX0_9EURY|nr:hypothetical protein AKJ56_00295 [candidate division MSBL1 archaeon SCGC-AAA382N08]